MSNVQMSDDNKFLFCWVINEKFLLRSWPHEQSSETHLFSLSTWVFPCNTPSALCTRGYESINHPLPLWACRRCGRHVGAAAVVLEWSKEWLQRETSGAGPGTGRAERLAQQEVVDELPAVRASDETWVTSWAHEYDRVGAGGTVALFLFALQTLACSCLQKQPEPKCNNEVSCSQANFREEKALKKKKKKAGINNNLY